MEYSVGQVAGFAGVTVRTLHHYDKIGLLSPSERSAAGYRQYNEADLDRLQQILFYRELGFTLDEITTIVDDPDADPISQLRRQHQLLHHRITHYQRMVVAVEQAMEAHHTGIRLTPQQRFEIFGDFTPPDGYVVQAHERWGDTKQWHQARERMSSYSKQDWKRMQAEIASWVTRLLAAIGAGATPDSDLAMDLVEEHRQHLNRWMYDCDYQFHQQLTELYVTEPVQLSFLVHPDQQLPGLGEFIRDAAKANANRG